MPEFEISVTSHAWTLTVGSFRLEATGVIRDRGNIRVTLSVYGLKEGKLLLLHRDNVNLTGEKARQRLLKRLKELSIEIEEKALLALDEAIRRTPAPSRNGHSPDSDHHHTPSDVSETPLSLPDLKAVYDRWLLVKDQNLLEVVLGAVVAHRLGGESPWLFLVAPPSGVKTEMLRALYKASGIYPLSDLTARTFASGLDTAEREPSLLARLHDEVLVLKDFTTVLELHREERQAILAQLREIYDGRYDKVWGTGKELHWTGRLGFLAGVTPVIDQHHAVMAILGPRFLQFRPEQPDRLEVAEKAMGNAGRELLMREELATTTARFLPGIPTTHPEHGMPMVKWLARTADVVTKARSAVIRDGYRRELDYAPEPESPPRFARQLQALTQGVTLVNGHKAATIEDALCITRVARDCIPKVRQVALQEVLNAPGGVKTTDVAQSAQYSTATVRRALEDLQALGLTHCEKAGKGQADSWSPTGDSREALQALFNPEQALRDTFPAMSEGVSYAQEEVVEWVG
jgi:hypothetical protein